MISNQLRDASNAIFEKLSYTITSNWVGSAGYRHIQLERPAPKFTTVSARNAWKLERCNEVKAAGLILYDEDKGTIKSRTFSIYGQFPNEMVPGYVAKVKEKKADKQELPKSVADYIINTLGHSLKKVIAHRHVNGEEPKYAVLMGGEGYMWTVIFVGSYRPRHPLGPFEEAYAGNAVLVKWECLSDADEWEHSVEKFKNAPSDFF